MLTQSFHVSFKRDYKLMQKRNKDISKLIEVMTLLINEQPLPPKYKNHPLHGVYRGWWECHIEPDWLLIYRVDKNKHRVVFYRTGTHSDLF
jgi:mRNA interferase YafQ